MKSSNVLSYVNWYKLNESSSGKLILSGGLDTRSGDKSISEQVEMVESVIDKSINVMGFRYNDSVGLLKAITDNQNTPVIMFSAGCQHASKVADAASNKNLVYIVEPYHAGGATTKAVQNAIKKGVPSGNVMTGPTSSRGKGIVTGSKNTESGKSHWDSLPYAAGVYISGSSNVDTGELKSPSSTKNTDISGTTDNSSDYTYRTRTKTF